MSERILRCLSSHRFSHGSESELQEAIAEAFDAEGIEYQREAVLGDDRPDFLVGDVALEVKVDGSRAAVIRQLYRYALHNRVRALVLATTRLQHRMPEAMGDKPVRVAYLGRL